MNVARTEADRRERTVKMMNPGLLRPSRGLILKYFHARSEWTLVASAIQT